MPDRVYRLGWVLVRVEVELMDRRSLARAIYKVSHLTGDFTLRTGKKSTEYFDKYQFESHPTLLSEIAEIIATGIYFDDSDVLAGLELGGVPIATLVSVYTGLPVVFVRKAAKTYGTCKLAEGVDVAGKRLVLIEDVITTGGQVVESAKALRALGATVSAAICVILRDEAGATYLRENGIHPINMFTAQGLEEASQDS